MLKMLQRIILYALSSLLMSFFMFIFVFSIMTQQFPPDLGLIKRTFSGLKQINQMTLQLNQKNSQANKAGDKVSGSSGPEKGSDDNGEEQVNILQQFDQRKAELWSKIMAEKGAPDGQGGVVSDSTPSQALKDKVKDLEFEIMRLQNRVGALEAKIK